MALGSTQWIWGHLNGFRVDVGVISVTLGSFQCLWGHFSGFRVDLGVISVPLRPSQ